MRSRTSVPSPAQLPSAHTAHSFKAMDDVEARSKSTSIYNAPGCGPLPRPNLAQSTQPSPLHLRFLQSWPLHTSPSTTRAHPPWCTMREHSSSSLRNLRKLPTSLACLASPRDCGCVAPALSRSSELTGLEGGNPKSLQMVGNMVHFDFEGGGEGYGGCTVLFFVRVII